MTRSEEQLHVGTERVETGRARLRKYVVTEQETVSVPSATKRFASSGSRSLTETSATLSTAPTSAKKSTKSSSPKNAP